jgi:hypothetical protein
VGTAEDGVRVLILLGIFEGLHEQRPPHRQPAVVWDPKREVDDGSTSGLKKPKPEVEEAAWTPPPECRAGQLRFAAADPEDFPSQQARMLTSFNDELPATDDFAEAWSRSEAKKEAASSSRWRTFHRADVATPAKAAAPPCHRQRWIPRTRAPTKTVTTSLLREPRPLVFFSVLISWSIYIYVSIEVSRFCMPQNIS